MIPQIIWQFWDGGPNPYAEYMATWALQDWDHNILTQSDITDFDQYVHPELYQQGNPWRMVANVARFDYLWQHGGIWVDCDMELVGGVAALTEDRCALGKLHHGPTLQTSIIAAEPRHPFIGRCLDWLLALEPDPKRISSSVLAVNSLADDTVTIWPPGLCYPNTRDGTKICEPQVVVNHPRSPSVS